MRCVLSLCALTLSYSIVEAVLAESFSHTIVLHCLDDNIVVSQEAPASSSREAVHQAAQLRWVLPEMKEYKLVRELLELHSAHRRQLQALWKTFNREEADRKLQLAG